MTFSENNKNEELKKSKNSKKFMYTKANKLI